MEIRGVTQQDVAEQIGMDQTSISKIKRGKSRSPRKLDDIAAYLNVPVEWLRYGTAPEKLAPKHLQAAADIADMNEADQERVIDLIRRLKQPAD